jgi:hypothetical protein
MLRQPQSPIDSRSKNGRFEVVMVGRKKRDRGVGISLNNFEYGQRDGGCSAAIRGLYNLPAGSEVRQLSRIIHSVCVVQGEKGVLVQEKRSKPIPSVAQQGFSAEEFAELLRPAVS